MIENICSVLYFTLTFEHFLLSFKQSKNIILSFRDGIQNLYSPVRGVANERLHKVTVSLTQLI
jgi:hypothetical protein